MVIHTCRKLLSSCVGVEKHLSSTGPVEQNSRKDRSLHAFVLQPLIYSVNISDRTVISKLVAVGIFSEISECILIKDNGRLQKPQKKQQQRGIREGNRELGGGGGWSGQR